MRGEEQQVEAGGRVGWAVGRGGEGLGSGAGWGQ